MNERTNELINPSINRSLHID